MSVIEDEVSNINDVSFTKVSGWSDQCHFTTKKYYEEALELIGPDRQHPEDPLTIRAHTNCTRWGPHFYGSLAEGPFIYHMRGRLTNSNKITVMALAMKKDAKKIVNTETLGMPGAYTEIEKLLAVKEPIPPKGA
jgi:hypothetical protein